MVLIRKVSTMVGHCDAGSGMQRANGTDGAGHRRREGSDGDISSLSDGR